MQNSGQHEQALGPLATAFGSLCHSSFEQEPAYDQAAAQQQQSGWGQEHPKRKVSRSLSSAGSMDLDSFDGLQAAAGASGLRRAKKRCSSMDLARMESLLSSNCELPVPPELGGSDCQPSAFAPAATTAGHPRPQPQRHPSHHALPPRHPVPAPSAPVAVPQRTQHPAGTAAPAWHAAAAPPPPHVGMAHLLYQQGQVQRQLPGHAVAQRAARGEVAGAAAPHAPPTAFASSSQDEDCHAFPADSPGAGLECRESLGDLEEGFEGFHSASSGASLAALSPAIARHISGSSSGHSTAFGLQPYNPPCQAAGMNAGDVGHLMALSAQHPAGHHYVHHHQHQQQQPQRQPEVCPRPYPAPVPAVAPVPVPVTVHAPVPAPAAPARPAPVLTPQQRLAAELLEANTVLGCIEVPEGCAFVPVHEQCSLIPLCTVYGIPPIAIALGASYFQRLMARNKEMQEMAAENGFFVRVPRAPGCPPGPPILMMRSHPGADTTLLIMYTACIYVAAKVSDRVQYKMMLSAMLSNLVDYKIDPKEAVRMEEVVLSGLDWRLGPIFNHN